MCGQIATNPVNAAFRKADLIDLCMNLCRECFSIRVRKRDAIDKVI